MKRLKITIFIAIFLRSHVESSSDPAICSSALLLSSGLINVNSIPPNIAVELPEKIASGERVKINVKGLTDVRKLSIQARSNDGSSIGSFLPSIEANLTNCRGHSQTFAIYRKPSYKNDIEIAWEPPVVKEEINFRFFVTIIQSSTDFYPPYITDAITVESVNDNELDLIYDGCESQKVCFGIPEGCVMSRNCNLFGAADFIDGSFEFELLSMENQSYVALGVSQSPLMGNTSNVECIQETPGVITAYTSWMSPPRVVARSGVDQTIIQFLEGRLINGRIYCKIRRDAFSIVNDHIIDLENEKHFLLIAAGVQLRPDSVGSHQANRGATSEAISLTPSIYDGCNGVKVCHGLPDGCVANRSCNLLGTVNYFQGHFDFELLSMPNQNYVALGVSQSPIMANTSNVECVQATLGTITAYSSWMSPPRTVSRTGVNQTVIQLLESRFIDGRIYCKIRREPVTTVNDHVIDLENDDHYLLIAGGIFMTDISVGPHEEHRGATSEQLSLTSPSPPLPTEAPPTAPPSDFPIYDGCGNEKLCFGMPDGCVSNRNCQLVVSSRKVNSEFFEFEMLSNPLHYYVALGLSQTQSMGQASVVECTHAAGSVSAFASWNFDLENSREGVQQTFVRLREGRVVNGRIYCKIERDTQTVVRDETFNLETHSHYLLIAGGISGFGSVGTHLAFRHMSSERVWLANPGEIRGAPMSPLMLTHGSLMIVSWIGLTSIGVVVARYFKPFWPNQKMFGKDLWFVCHVSCMTLTWVLALIGFVLIFVDLGVWRTTTHSILGCIVFTFATLQVVGGLMRPDPKADNRPVFNWMHQAFGNVTHLLAVLCIFYAIPLPAARLPSFTIYVLIGFVSFYFLIHFFLMTYEVKGRTRKVSLEKQNNQVSKPPYSILKVTFLGVHVVMILIFVIGLILIFAIDF